MDLANITQDQDEESVVERLKQEIDQELESTQKESKEIGLLLEQTRLEISKIQQKNEATSAQLQQIQSQIESASTNEIRVAYEAALDIRQRLFLMRGQVEKLESDLSRLDHYRTVLNQVGGTLSTIKIPKEETKKDSIEIAKSVEMIVQAQEAERGRLARKMHDGPAQALSNFILQAEIAMRLFDIDQAKAKAELTDIRSTASNTFQKVRDFIFELRPMMLDDLGLVPTITRYLESYKDQTGINVKFTPTGLDQRFESYREIMVFRAIQEILSNISQYSQASQVSIQMDTTATGLRLTIEDNGKGLDVDKVYDQPGVGLKLIKDRVEMLGGTMDIKNISEQGSNILMQLPITSIGSFA